MSVKPLNRSIVESAQDDVGLTIAIFNRQRTRKINARALKKITEALLAELEIKKAELGVNLIGATEMARLNEKFLQHAGSTDVITFDYQKSELKLHGELFICVDEAILQSKKFKTDWRSEVIRYMIHGVLHLIGFNDARAKAKQKMKREENRLLRELSKEFSLAQIAGPSKISA
jgi:probable rRNA maturation factor